MKSLLVLCIPFLKSFLDCKRNGEFNQMTYFEYLKFRLGFSQTYWPKAKTCMVGHPNKIYVGKNAYIGRPFSYIQGAGGIYVGDYARIATHVCLLSSNHDLYDHRVSHKKPIVIGNNCWVGTQCCIMAGVTLGPYTIVAANSTVTKSFPQGYCVIGGCPAKIIKELNPDEIVKYKTKKEYYGFIPSSEFNRKKNKYIDKATIEFYENNVKDIESTK